jgi:hypothetical protein
MLNKVLALFGLATLSAVGAETARADELERACGDLSASLKRVNAEREARPVDERAEALAAITAQVPVVLARHA